MSGDEDRSPLKLTDLIRRKDDALYENIWYCIGQIMLQSFWKLAKCRICTLEAEQHVSLAWLGQWK